MQINLKQQEIVEALKQYISNQGISLSGKSVEISFTSGRKDNGLSAEMNIEEGVQSNPPRVNPEEYAVPPVEADSTPVTLKPKLFGAPD